ncbi:MAG: hypothetical protein ABI444_09465 [Candidatus Kapaibacterium sp.]|jgi:hypothetical protein
MRLNRRKPAIRFLKASGNLTIRTYNGNLGYSILRRDSLWSIRAEGLIRIEVSNFQTVARDSTNEDTKPSSNFNAC